MIWSDLQDKQKEQKGSIYESEEQNIKQSNGGLTGWASYQDQFLFSQIQVLTHKAQTANEF